MTSLLAPVTTLVPTAGDRAGSTLALTNGGLMMATAATRIYEFTVILAGVSVLTVQMADALFEAGCDDASPGSCEGVVLVDFHREAESLGDAIGSAIRDVERAGFWVARVVVNQDEISSGKNEN